MRRKHKPKLETSEIKNELSINQKIYNSFLKTEVQDFSQLMGYGQKEIESIGTDKFIEVMGWTKESEVKSWRTDVVKITICPHCKNEFGMFPLDLGFCPNCLKLYDVALIENTLTGIPKSLDKNQAISKTVLYLIQNNEHIRNQFLRRDFSQMKKYIVDNNFRGIMSTRFMSRYLVGYAAKNTLPIYNQCDENTKLIINRGWQLDLKTLGNEEFDVYGLADSARKVSNKISEEILLIVNVLENELSHTTIKKAYLKKPERIQRAIEVLTSAIFNANLPELMYDEEVWNVLLGLDLTEEDIKEVKEKVEIFSA